ncbi:hypothetical protein GCM10023196_074910 [Actinoallomurus vinaceus]|uniref:NlpC/P60 domain-containing protein n=1 Tax=Actinoallomurus vinaceus TaxID=1080074 RepID=A0ABP8UMK9_9ACTN
MRITAKTLAATMMAAGLTTTGMATAHAAVAAPAAAAPAAAKASDVTAQSCKGNPGSNLHLTRAQIKTRAHSWLGKVTYSQSHYYCNGYGRYRQDCSGYVSMAWGLHTSQWTGSLLNYSHAISKNSLRYGDVLTRYPQSTSKGHVAIFMSRASRGRVVVWEESRPGTKAGIHTWSKSLVASYSARRYNNVR